MQTIKGTQTKNSSPTSFLKREKIYGLPLGMFALFAALIFFTAFTGKLSTDYVGIIAFLMALGGIFFWIGNKVPILNDYMGLAMVLPLFAAGAMNTYGVIPEYLSKGVGAFMKGGFQNLYVAAILVGSILSLNRKSIIKSVAKYLPTIIGSQAMAIAFLAIAGIVTGIGVFQAIFMVGAPTMSGGSGGAIATLPAMYSKMMNMDANKLAGPFLGYCSLANVISILSGAVLSRVLDKSKTLNGHGRLLMDEGHEEDMVEEERASSSSDYTKLGAGLLISLAFMVSGKLVAAFFPQLADLAWTIIIAVILKSVGLISEEICDYASYWLNFMLKNLLPALIVGIGISSMDISLLGTYFTLKIFFVIVMGIAGAFLGAAIFGRLFRLWPLEAGITAALCSCDIGGSGDIAILGASNRMQLLPFSSISTRIGGALMVLEISILMPLFIK
jgi:malate:Na+ symporter